MSDLNQVILFSDVEFYHWQAQVAPPILPSMYAAEEGGMYKPWAKRWGAFDFNENHYYVPIHAVVWVARDSTFYRWDVVNRKMGLWICALPIVGFKAGSLGGRQGS